MRRRAVIVTELLALLSLVGWLSTAFRVACRSDDPLAPSVGDCIATAGHRAGGGDMVARSRADKHVWRPRMRVSRTVAVVTAAIMGCACVMAGCTVPIASPEAGGPQQLTPALAAKLIATGDDSPVTTADPVALVAKPTQQSTGEADDAAVSQGGDAIHSGGGNVEVYNSDEVARILAYGVIIMLLGNYVVGKTANRGVVALLGLLVNAARKGKRAAVPKQPGRF